MATRPGESEQWSRIKSVFLEALELPEADQAEFVARACDDDAALRDEIMSLLASERAAGDFCETPAGGMLASGTPGETAAVPRREPGARFGPYEVTAFLAAGGMGEVYRARHTVLNRLVAIKTVNAQLADPLARRRLIREAQHASVLCHPNICTIHEVGDVDGTPFIVMALVEGRPLNEAIRAKPPALDEALDYAMQIADALEHAHGHGIVHRDLKSANVVIDATGRAIVLDFGLAKRLPADAGGAGSESTLTTVGALAGTLSHMAPEVLLGCPADARSDVWSLGVLLYELVSGELPFTGRTPFETSSAILEVPPRPLSRRIPLALRLVIERCLTKDPERRYQRAADVRAALTAIRRRRQWPVVGRLLVSMRRRTLAAVAAAAVVASLLVVGALRLREALRAAGPARAPTVVLLPLENATGDTSAAYYGEGIGDGLIAQLGAVTDVRVISGASAARAMREERTRVEIARRLGATMLVEGTLHRARDRVVVDMRLFRPPRERVVWSGRFDAAPNEVLALQADVVRALALEVRLAVRPEARERLSAVRAVSPDVYEAYLKGRYEWNQRTVPSLQRAIDHFKRAVELDPTYAPAHAALADCYNQLGTVVVSSGSPRRYRPLAAAAAIRALQIDPHAAEAHATLGYVHHYEWRWKEAEEEFRRAIELNPSYALAHLWYANLLMSLGRVDEAIQRVFVARELDPLSLIVNSNVGWILTNAGRVDDAIAQLQQTVALDSSYAQARWRLAAALVSAGRLDEARMHGEHFMRLTQRSPPSVSLLATIHARAGRPDSARTLLRELIERSRVGYVPPFMISKVYDALGDVDSALIWFTKAFEERSNAMAYFRYDSLPTMRHDPRFRALVARTGLD